MESIDLNEFIILKSLSQDLRGKDWILNCQSGKYCEIIEGYEIWRWNNLDLNVENEENIDLRRKLLKDGKKSLNLVIEKWFLKKRFLEQLCLFLIKIQVQFMESFNLITETFDASFLENSALVLSKTQMWNL